MLDKTISSGFFLRALAAVVLCVLGFAWVSTDAQAAAAPVEVSEAWVRATVPGQMGTGGFLRLTAHEEGIRLVAARTSAAGVVQLHQMHMDSNSVMQMRQIPYVALQKGRAVQFAPGGLHLMLMDLKHTLTQGSSLWLTLIFRDAKNTESQLRVEVPVQLERSSSSNAHHAEH